MPGYGDQLRKKVVEDLPGITGMLGKIPEMVESIPVPEWLQRMLGVPAASAPVPTPGDWRMNWKPEPNEEQKEQMRHEQMPTKKQR